MASQSHTRDETISMYQPQVETWKGDEVRAYAALSVMSTTNKTTKYGVLWFTARTEVDKVNRQVTLDDFRITKVKFPRWKLRRLNIRSSCRPSCRKRPR